jgi:DNA (cytosine-5)-methyltransferase 1
MLTGAGNLAFLIARLAGVGGRAGQRRLRDAAEPFATFTSKADAAVVTAVLVHAAHGEMSSRRMAARWPA